jgi:hypothetical protein
MTHFNLLPTVQTGYKKLLLICLGPTRTLRQQATEFATLLKFIKKSSNGLIDIYLIAPPIFEFWDKKNQNRIVR